MDLSGFLSSVLEVAGSFNLEIALALFLVCLIGEAGLVLPYILEIIWLFAGFRVAGGTLSPTDLFCLWLIAQAGRQAGSLSLYYSGIFGQGPFVRFFHRFIRPRLPRWLVLPPRFVRLLINPSLFFVTAVRLLGLRAPVTLTLIVQRRLLRLNLGVLISGVIWDAAFLAVGYTFGITIVSDPVRMFFYSLGGLTVLYLLVVGFRFLIHSRFLTGKTVS